MKTIGSCPICHSDRCQELSRRRVSYPGPDPLSHLQDIDYVRNYILFEKILHTKEPIDCVFYICKDCGFIFFSPRPEDNDMVIKYALVNELGDSKQREDYLYFGKTSDEKRAFEMHKLVSEFGSVRNTNVIDIGGARGLNLKYFLDSNNCFVVDYEKHELLKGVRALCATAQEIPESLRAGVVLYCHILEHVADPVREIRAIKNILEPGGLLYIEVPFGCWREYQHTRNLLTHVNFFSEGSLYHLLDSCGLSIEYLKLRPALGRMLYNPVIVAIAQNSPPRNKEIEPYRVTRHQMSGRHVWLRAYLLFLNIRLMKFRLLIAAYRYYRLRWRNRRNAGVPA
jgi:SAM-dependent methyltransferase